MHFLHKYRTRRAGESKSGLILRYRIILLNLIKMHYGYMFEIFISYVAWHIVCLVSWSNELRNLVTQEACKMPYKWYFSSLLNNYWL